MMAQTKPRGTQMIESTMPIRCQPLSRNFRIGALPYAALVAIEVAPVLTIFVARAGVPEQVTPDVQHRDYAEEHLGALPYGFPHRGLPIATSGRVTVGTL